MPCLKQPVIDFTRPLPECKCGIVVYRTNLERTQKGEAPILENGERVELHHIGQNPDSPLAELTVSEHRRGQQNKLLHTSTNVASKIDRHDFAIKIKRPYWRARAREYLENEGKQHESD